MPIIRTALATHPFVKSGLVLAAVGAAIGLGLMLEPAPRVAMPALPTIPAQPIVKLDRLVAVPPVASAIPAVDPRAKELALGFTLKKTAYAQLAALATQKWPAHGAWKLIDDEGIHAVIAPVAVGDLPSDVRAWAERTVKVDNRCTAKVTGFAIVSWLTGDPAYAGVDAEHWTVRSVRENGTPMLVATLDGCGEQSIRYVRDAELPDVVALEKITDKKLAARAKARLIASRAAAATQREWIEFHPGTRWESDKNTQFETLVLRHPTTGITWISVHASAEYGCGEPKVNVWGLYKVVVDGQLETIETRQLDPITTIDELLDVDNDGALELYGHAWLGDAILSRPDGKVLTSLGVPFYGCPC